MRNIIYLLLVLFLCACNIKKEESKEVVEKTIESKVDVKSKKGEQTSKIEYYVTECDSINVKSVNQRKKDIVLYTFKNNSYVYCSPSVKSTVIDTLQINTEVLSTNSLTIAQFKKDSKKVKFWKAFWEIKVNNKKGYVLQNDLSKKRLGEEFLLGYDIRRKNRYYNKILRVTKEHKKIDSLEVEYYYGNRNMSFFEESNLAFVDKIIDLSSYRGSCPGGSASTYIAINENGEMKKIISLQNSSIGYTDVFFPTKTDKGIVFKRKNANGLIPPATVDFLQGLNIPLNELILEKDVNYAGDIEGLDADEIEIANEKITIYRWNGKALTEVVTEERGKYLAINEIKTDYPEYGKAYVIAENGLSYREFPDVKSKKIGTFDLGTDLIIEENSGIPLEIKDGNKTLNGFWVKVKSKVNREDESFFLGKDYKHVGYVFNGYLIDSLNVKFKKEQTFE